jgi:eukaryotic-like serine/threonine-protein kinase
MNDRDQPVRHDDDAERTKDFTAPLPESDATVAATPGDASAGEAPGAWIGPYRLLQPIGEGGFGTVFLAEQTEPIRRRVALKIIKLGMDTRQVVARFEQERQALALMDHPGIARVLDAGATSTGRPYFVMELVEGEPVSDHADRHRLDLHARLELVSAVCLAVQHAHTKGVIHRDLKPSNILVGRQDDRAVAKVIDFGIAKATDVRLTERTIDTRLHHFVGTPSYMSPEQAAGSLDIDTRTDVYALGVVLYELLTGSTPFDATTLRSATYAEIQRIIHEVEPPPPSARLSRQPHDVVGAIAARRSTDPARLLTTVRGELDWIVMKALDKDRTRRYESAGALAADIGRYLAHEPVVAAPPGAAYRLRKFVRRHRGAVVAGAAVTVALVLGLAGFAWQADVAGRQRDRALEAEDIARNRAEELALVADFQASMLAQVDPAAAGRHLTADVTRRYDEAVAVAGEPDDARQARSAAFATQWERVNATDAAVALIDQTILRPSVAAITSRFADQPAVAAQLRQTLADRYRALGLYDDAMPLQAAALADRRTLLGDDDPATLVSVSRLGLLLMNQGRLDEAEQAFREAVARTPRVLGPITASPSTPSPTSGSCSRRRDAWTRPNRTSATPLRPDAVPSARTTPARPSPSATSATCSNRRASWTRPNRCTARPWRRADACAARTTPSRWPPSATWARCCTRRDASTRPSHTIARPCRGTAGSPARTTRRR